MKENKVFIIAEIKGKEFNQDIDKGTPLSLKDINYYEK